VARLFGLDLLRIFAFPYFSRDIAEFWRRWHISLSSWFKDYLYIPLGGSKGGMWMNIRNTVIIFLVSGFWHGANWTFILWGLLNALYIMPSIVFKTNRNNLDIAAKGKYFPTPREFAAIGMTFSLTVFAWIFFRASNVMHAVRYIGEIFSQSLFTLPQEKAFTGRMHPLTLCLLLVIFFLIEWLGREQQYAIAKLGSKWHTLVRWTMYYAILLAIFYFTGKEQQFIYFQF
jgi:D-alanyl-lipoteichoic acid acyltransferase DltB (MBOAT superfamily)